MSARELLWCYGLGTVFGVVLVQGEIVSWFRIHEMFRFESFHMYGVIGSALAVAAPSLWLMRRSNMRSFDGQAITVPPKTIGTGVRYLAGGTIFGLGWGVTGACPGPLRRANWRRRERDDGRRRRRVRGHVDLRSAASAPAALIMAVQHWNIADGPFSESALRAKLESMGYRVARYVYEPGTVFPDHKHDVDKIDAVLSGRFRLVVRGHMKVLGPGRVDRDSTRHRAQRGGDGRRAGGQSGCGEIVKIAIFGSGGVGGYFGAKLAAAGEEVTFLARGAHLKAMQDGGLHVDEPAGFLPSAKGPGHRSSASRSDPWTWCSSP